MDESRPSQNGLTRPHVRFSFLKTASESLFLSEEDFSGSARDSLESDSESLAQEKQYQLDLQQRIRNGEELLSQCYCEPEEDSCEEDSLEAESLSGTDESNVEEEQMPTGSNRGEEDCSSNDASSKAETTGGCTDLQCSPEWKTETGGIIDLNKSHLEDAPSSLSPSLSLTSSPSQDRFTAKDHQVEEGQRDVPSVSEKELLNGCAGPASISDESRQSPKKREQEEEVEATCQDKSTSCTYSHVFPAQTKEFKEQRPEKDFIRKNKLTLGFVSRQKNSYLQLYSKKQIKGQGTNVACNEKTRNISKQTTQRDRRCLGPVPGSATGSSKGTGCETESAHQCKRPEMGGTNSSQAASSKESSVHYPLGVQVELRGQFNGHHNELESENTPSNSGSYREVPHFKQDSRGLLPCRLHPNPPVTLPWPSVATGDQDLQLHTDPISLVRQDGKEASVNLTAPWNPLQPGSYSNSPVFHSPCTGENSRKYPPNASERQQHLPHRCAVSEPCRPARHGKHQKALGHKHPSSGLHQLVNEGLLSWDSRNRYTEDICTNYVSGDPGSSQPLAHDLKGGLSPTEWLIQVAEKHHREISQLADQHLASMLPPILQRGESDSQLHLESGNGTQRFLCRSNSEGYLLQMEKQVERKEKENRKASRAKGYVNLDVKLGGLGPDFEMIKEKAEKIKQQKEYAKQIKEHNMNNIISVRKPLPRSENKLVVSRQKALEYAKTIPKPKIVLSKPSEQEPGDETILSHALHSENLPPISSLESLQNRHEREKQVVAAFKTLHIV